MKVAAAAGVRVLDCGSIPVDFRVDQPILFFLRDKLTGWIIFRGRVSDPSA